MNFALTRNQFIIGICSFCMSLPPASSAPGDPFECQISEDRYQHILDRHCDYTLHEQSRFLVNICQSKAAMTIMCRRILNNAAVYDQRQFPIFGPIDVDGNQQILGYADEIIGVTTIDNHNGTNTPCARVSRTGYDAQTRTYIIYNFMPENCKAHGGLGNGN